MAFISIILWLCHVTLRISDAAQVIQRVPPEIVVFIFCFENMIGETVLKTG